jgi:hypothetical protein
MPAFIGLGGTIVGSAIVLTSQFLLERKRQEFEKQKQEYERQKEIKKKKAEKLEELVATLYEHKEWLQIREGISLWRSEEKLPVTPFSKLEAIANVYFPELETQLKALVEATSNYETWVFKASKLAKTTGNVVTKEMLDAYAPYSSAFISLLNETKDYAKREFQ